MLARSASQITTLEVIRFLDGPVHPFDCEGDNPVRKCSLGPDCVFMPLWQRARQALENVYGGTTLQDLVDAQAAAIPDFSI